MNGWYLVRDGITNILDEMALVVDASVRRNSKASFAQWLLEQF